MMMVRKLNRTHRYSTSREFTYHLDDQRRFAVVLPPNDVQLLHQQ
jgi:hypothetical protein